MAILVRFILLMLVFGILATVVPAVMWPVTALLGLAALGSLVVFLLARVLGRGEKRPSQVDAAVATWAVVLTAVSGFAAWSVDHDAKHWSDLGFGRECAESAVDEYRELQSDSVDPTPFWEQEQGESDFVMAVCG